MTCTICGEEHICIIPGPTKVIDTKPDDRPERWCFGCRKRLPHTWRCYWDHTLEEAATLPIEELTYYDPVWVLECSQCGKDRTDFPGSTW